MIGTATQSVRNRAKCVRISYDAIARGAVCCKIRLPLLIPGQNPRSGRRQTASMMTSRHKVRRRQQGTDQRCQGQGAEGNQDRKGHRRAPAGMLSHRRRRPSRSRRRVHRRSPDWPWSEKPRRIGLAACLLISRPAAVAEYSTACPRPWIARSCRRLDRADPGALRGPRRVGPRHRPAKKFCLRRIKRHAARSASQDATVKEHHNGRHAQSPGHP